MTETVFNPDGDLIIIRGVVVGPYEKEYDVRFALDTGTGVTILAPYVIDSIGLGARQGVAFSTTRSVVGKERGYAIGMPRVTALGMDAADLLVHVYELPDGWDIDGLLGLDFLRRLNYEVRSAEGRILAAPVYGSTSPR